MTMMALIWSRRKGEIKRPKQYDFQVQLFRNLSKIKNKWWNKCFKKYVNFGPKFQKNDGILPLSTPHKNLLYDHNFFFPQLFTAFYSNSKQHHFFLSMFSRALTGVPVARHKLKGDKFTIHFMPGVHKFREETTYYPIWNWLQIYLYFWNSLPISRKEMIEFLKRF